MAPYRVLVVDDSVFMRKIISDLILEDPQFVVIDTAKNGKEAVEKVKLLSPDVVTMDLEMPLMNGLEALDKIMPEHPTPVIMISSLTMEGASATIKALELGAIDFIRKPSGSVSLDLFKVKHLLHEKLQIAVKSSGTSVPPVQVQNQPPVKPPEPLYRAPIPPKVTKPPARQALPPKETLKEPPAARTPMKSTLQGAFRQIVAIGTSTGGPRALNTVLTKLPESFQAPILIVQHMPPNFTKSLAKRLDEICQIQVVEAEHGMTLAKGTAYIAPGGWHMRVRKNAASGYAVELSKEEPRSGHRPSVDVLFESIAPLTELKRHAVIMTGMGSDGAKGMLTLRESGAATTIAEAEETCVVYGMPRSAVLNGSVTCISPLHEIPNRLIQAVQGELPMSSEQD